MSVFDEKFGDVDQYIEHEIQSDDSEVSYNPINVQIYEVQEFLDAHFKGIKMKVSENLAKNESIAGGDDSNKVSIIGGEYGDRVKIEVIEKSDNASDYIYNILEEKYEYREGQLILPTIVPNNIFKIVMDAMPSVQGEKLLKIAKPLEKIPSLVVKTFIYRSEGDIQLNDVETNELAKVDAWLYPLLGYKCLGELHDTIDVIISDKQPVRETKVRYRLIDLRPRLEADKKEKDGILAQIKNEPNCANHEHLKRRLKGFNSEIENLTKRIHEHEGKDENAAAAYWAKKEISFGIFENEREIEKKDYESILYDIFLILIFPSA